MIRAHAGPGVVRLRERTPISLHTIGQRAPLASAAIQGDRVTMRAAGMLVESLRPE